MPTSLRGARILAADLSLSCSGICIFDLDSMLPIEGRAFPKADPGPIFEGRGVTIYERASDVIHVIAEAYPKDSGIHFDHCAFEGSAVRVRWRNEETTAVRQSFWEEMTHRADDLVPIVVNPREAKLALTGKGNADKMAMVNAALAQTRGTPFFDTLSALVKKGRKHNFEAEAIADAFGVARAAAKILFQRNAASR